MTGRVAGALQYTEEFVSDVDMRISVDPEDATKSAFYAVGACVEDTHYAINQVPLPRARFFKDIGVELTFQGCSSRRVLSKRLKDIFMEARRLVVLPGTWANKLSAIRGKLLSKAYGMEVFSIPKHWARQYRTRVGQILKGPKMRRASPVFFLRVLPQERIIDIEVMAAVRKIFLARELALRRNCTFRRFQAAGAEGGAGGGPAALLVEVCETMQWTMNRESFEVTTHVGEVIWRGHPRVIWSSG